MKILLDAKVTKVEKGANSVTAMSRQGRQDVRRSPPTV
jgi:hypothetical protein